MNRNIGQLQVHHKETLKPGNKGRINTALQHAMQGIAQRACVDSFKESLQQGINCVMLGPS